MHSRLIQGEGHRAFPSNFSANAKKMGERWVNQRKEGQAYGKIRDISVTIGSTGKEPRASLKSGSPGNQGPIKGFLKKG